MILPLLPADIPSPTINVPTPSLTNLQGSTNVLATLLIRDGPDCTDISRYRTTTNIVLSCLTTILACTWVALHLNIPKSHKSKWKCFWRRFGWMIVALIAPEFIAGIAIKERLAAKKYMDEWNLNCASLCSPELVEIQGKTSKQYKRELWIKKYDSQWTLTHGFLAGMGGLRLYDDNDHFPKKFRPGAKIFEDPRMRSVVQQIGLISAKDIEDKSKGDGISKFFVLVQTTWFIVQCLARWAIHLPVTELEVVTLAYAVQNIFIYTLWWNKPQSLAVPYRFYLEKDEKIPENPEVKGENKVEEVRRSPSPAPVEETRDTNVRLGRSRRGRKRSLLADKQISKNPEVKGESKVEEVPLMRRSPSPAPAEEVQHTNVRLQKSRRGQERSVLAGEQISKNPEVKRESKMKKVSLIVRPSPSPLAAPVEKAQDTNVRRGKSRRDGKQSLLADEGEWVQPTHSGVQGLIMGIFGGDGYWIFLLLAGTIFGALHLIPLWNSEFPSDVEKKLWQVSAFYVTVAPLGLPVAGLVAMLVFGTLLCCCCCGTEDFASGLTAVFAFCAAVAYGVARIILLVLPFTTLRSLPKEAFLSVEWTRFIPHF